MNSPKVHVTKTQKLLGNFAFFIGVTIWSTMFPATEYLLINWDPVAITFVRMGGGALVLLVAFTLLEDVSSTLQAAPWGKIFLLGIIGVSASTLLFAWGIKLSSAIAAALIATTGPIVATLITRFLYSEPLRRGIVLGVLLAVSGGICAVLGSGDRFDQFKGGEFLVLMAMSLWVWYSYNCQRWLPDFPQIGIAALTVTAGALGFATYVGVAEFSGFDDIRFGTSIRVDDSRMALYWTRIHIYISLAFWCQSNRCNHRIHVPESGANCCRSDFNLSRAVSYDDAPGRRRPDHFWGSLHPDSQPPNKFLRNPPDALYAFKSRGFGGEVGLVVVRNLALFESSFS